MRPWVRRPRHRTSNHLHNWFKLLLPLLLLLLIIIIIILTTTTNNNDTVSFHNFKSQNFKLSVSNPKNKHVAYLSVLSQISNCQGLGRKIKFDFWKLTVLTTTATTATAATTATTTTTTSNNNDYNNDDNSNNSNDNNANKQAHIIDTTCLYLSFLSCLIRCSIGHQRFSGIVSWSLPMLHCQYITCAHIHIFILQYLFYLRECYTGMQLNSYTSVAIYGYTYVCMNIYVCMYIYIYIYV